MTDLSPPPLPTPAAEDRPRMSLLARMLNVFAVPGMVFSEVRNSPFVAANWVVPAILGALVGLGSVWVILSDPAILNQLKARQEQLIEKRVKDGLLTAKEKQTAEHYMGPAVLKSFGAAGAVLGSFWSVLWWGLVLWIMARRLLRVQVGFGKALEIAGLSMMINVLGGIVGLLLMVSLKKIDAAAGVTLVTKSFEATRKGNAFAITGNVFAIWLVGVRAVGLARLTNAPFLRAAWLVATFWVLEQCFFVVSGLGQLGM
ncbi:MAG TPA: YIP1 family protein [Verrucomicrobiae bacterium]|nr:YIP1 family protein [Verrucomicrobiae bacterium]